MAGVSRLEFDRVKGLVDNLIFQLMPIGLTGEVSIPGDALQIGAILSKLQRFKGLYWFNSHWLPSGMVTTLTSGTGSITWNDYTILLGTGATSGSYAMASKTHLALGYIPATWDKKRCFLIACGPGTSTAQIIHLVTGTVSSYTAAANTLRHIGFKIINGVLYGTVADGTTESTLEITGIGSLTTNRVYEAIFTPASECRFYVDGVDKGVITTNLPSTAHGSAQFFFIASVSNTEAADKYIYTYTIRIYQEE